MTRWERIRELFELPYEGFWLVVFVAADRRLNETSPVTKALNFVEDTLGIR